VNTTLRAELPTAGTTVGVANANVPGILPAPPLSVEFDNTCPKVIAVAVGSVAIEDAAFFTTTVTFAVAVV
jgi:hypothetical protein